MSKTIYYNNPNRSVEDFFKLEVAKHIQKDEGAVFNKNSHCWIIKPVYE